MAQKSSDWSKARKQFEVGLRNSAKGVTKNAQQIFVNATSSFLDYVQMNKSLLPYSSGNLHDSIATAVSVSGRVIRANYMPKEATRPQTAPGRKRIIGEQEAFNAIRRFRPARTGVAATLFVSVPYAEGANRKSKHPGYYDWLQNAFVSEMRVATKVLEKYPDAKAPSLPKRRFDL